MNRLNVVVPKGSISESVLRLFGDAGISIRADERAYRPSVSDSELEVKIMRPQNIPELIELGAHDAGFTGLDWVMETGAKVDEVMDLGLDPVRIVAAVPANTEESELKRKRIVVASEYEKITKDFLDKSGYQYIFLRTYGATEVFPPEDADMIIDNTATGRTLADHNLRIVAELLKSSTRFIAHSKSMADSWKREKILELKTLFQSILDARGRVMLEMNVPREKFEAVIKVLPCMRSPTVAPLYGEQGFAVKTAVKKEKCVKLIPLLKKLGAMDILEYEFKKVVL